VSRLATLQKPTLVLSALAPLSPFLTETSSPQAGIRDLASEARQRTRIINPPRFIRDGNSGFSQLSRPMGTEPRGNPLTSEYMW
jgi:hypothetical protein